MAQKDKTTTTKTTVRRIKATDDAPKKVKKEITNQAKDNVKVAKTTGKAIQKTKRRQSNNPLKALGEYFKGAWHELKLVRWPTRSATWAMTGAVLLFTLMFVVLILLLDAGFNWAFEQLLK